MAETRDNSPMKEFTTALIGVAAFLGIVLLIGVSAFLRPAGHHVTPEPVADAEAAETVSADGTEETVMVGEVVDDSDQVVVATADAPEQTMSAEDSVAANVEPTDTLEAQPSTGNLRSDDVVVTESMDIGGQEASDTTQ